MTRRTRTELDATPAERRRLAAMPADPEHPDAELQLPPHPNTEATWTTDNDGMRGAEGVSIVGDPPEGVHGYPVNQDPVSGLERCPVCHELFTSAEMPGHMATHLGPPEPEVAPAEDPDKLGRVAVPIPGGGVLWVPPEFAHDIKFINFPTPPPEPEAEPEPELPDPVSVIEALFTRYDNELRVMRAERDQLNERIREVVKLHARLKSAHHTIRKP